MKSDKWILLLLSFLVLTLAATVALSACGDDDDDDNDDKDAADDDDNDTGDDDDTPDIESCEFADGDHMVIAANRNEMFVTFSGESYPDFGDQGGYYGEAVQAIVVPDLSSPIQAQIHFPQIEIFNKNGAFGFQIDPAGAMHVAYIGSEETLWYGTNASGVWELQQLLQVESEYFLYGPISLLLDSSGSAHIAFSKWDKPENNEVVYLTNAFGNWTIESLGNGYQQALAIDSNKKPHLIFIHNDGAYQVVHAVRNDSTWSKTVIDMSESNHFQHTSIEIDKNDHVHAAYSYSYLDEMSESYNCPIIYATNASGQWLIEAPDITETELIKWTRIAEVNNVLHIFGSGIHFFGKAGAWEKENLDGFGATGMTIGEDGYFYFFYNGTPMDIGNLYAYHNSHGDWVKCRVTPP